MVPWILGLSFYFCKEYCDVDWHYTGSVQFFWWNNHFYNISSFNPWAWEVFPSSSVAVNVCLWCFKFFYCRDFCLLGLVYFYIFLKLLWMRLFSIFLFQNMFVTDQWKLLVWCIYILLLYSVVSLHIFQWSLPCLTYRAMLFVSKDNFSFYFFYCY